MSSGVGAGAAEQPVELACCVMLFWGVRPGKIPGGRVLSFWLGRLDSGTRTTARSAMLSRFK
eukprot:8659212-Alexandrium_andersonii.AAC.1